MNETTRYPATNDTPQTRKEHAMVNDTVTLYPEQATETWGYRVERNEDPIRSSLASVSSGGYTDEPTAWREALHTVESLGDTLAEKSVRSVAQELYDSLERRDGERGGYRLVALSGEWAESIWSEVPADPWSEDKAHSILSNLADGTDPEDAADDLEDVYSDALWDWARQNTGDVDEAMSEYGTTSGSSLENLFGLGQHLAIERIAYDLIEALKKAMLCTECEVDNALIGHDLCLDCMNDSLEVVA